MASISHMLKLSEELLIHIFELIDDNHGVFNLRLICRQFKRLGGDVLSKRLTRLCVTSTPKLIRKFSEICDPPDLGQRVTEVIYVRRPGRCDDLDIIDHIDFPMTIVQDLRRPPTWSILPLDWWRRILTLRQDYFQKFRKGVRSLPRLSRLAYAREWPNDGAWNIMNVATRGPYPEPLNDDDVSLEDDWSGLRFVLETFKQIKASGRMMSLELSTPMGTGSFGSDIPALNSLRLKVYLVASTIPFLTQLDLSIPWYITDTDVHRRGMAGMLNRAVNLETFQLTWSYGHCMPFTLAAAVLAMCTWPKLRDFRLLRSGGYDWITAESGYERYDMTTLPASRLRAFFTRHQNIRKLYLRNIFICNVYNGRPVVWNEQTNSSPAIGPIRELLALLPLLRVENCSVALDTFDEISEDAAGDNLFHVNEEIEYLGHKVGRWDKRLEEQHPNIRSSYEFGHWLIGK